MVTGSRTQQAHRNATRRSSSPVHIFGYQLERSIEQRRYSPCGAPGGFGGYAPALIPEASSARQVLRLRLSD